VNVQRDPDAILATWLEDGPVRLPDATKRAIAVTTRTTRQSRRPMWTPWRFPPMTGATRFALGAVAVVAVALGGLYLFNPAPGGVIGGPGPTATPAASPTPTPMPFPSDTSDGAPVVPGTYVMDLPARDGSTGAATTLRITFTMPAGWEKNATPTILWHAVDHRRFGFYAVDNLIADPCATGGKVIEPRLGPTVDDLATGLARLPDLTASAATDVSVGGFSGKELGLTAPEGVSPCVDEPYIWTPVADANGFVPDGGAAAIMPTGDRLLLDILDVDGSRLVVARIDDPDAADPADTAELQAIVDSIRVERVAAAPSAAPVP